MSPRPATAAIVLLVLAICAAALGRYGPDALAKDVARDSRARTLATISSPVDGFAQNGRYLAWLERTPPRVSSCPVVLQTLRSGTRTRIARGAPSCESPDSLVLARNRAFWLDLGASNLQYFARLLTASPRDPRTREIDFQSVSNDGSEHLVPPASDGRSVYFWSSPEDLTPGPLIRFDGRRRVRLTGTIEVLQALSAADGRYAYAPKLQTFDCAQEPAWSHDGRLIAFASAAGRRPCRGGLWVMDADGGRLHQIAANGRHPDWSPDGSRLAFDASGKVVVSDANGANARVVVTNAVDPAWSPDGTKIAFERQTSIAVVEADGTGERIVAQDAGEPDWSPDGTRLAFTKRSTASRGLAIVGLDGGGPQSLTLDYDSQPAWSPDGRRIAYVHCWGPHSSCDLPRFGDATVLAVIAPDGSGRRELPMAVDAEETKDLAPSWSPDSEDIAFARVTEDSHIFKFSGLRLARRLTRAPAPRTPVVVRARNGRTLLRAEPRGVVVALAVSRAVAAAIVRDGAGWRLEVLSPRRRSVVLARRPAPELAVSGVTLVFRSGRSIFSVDARRGRPRLVARSSSTPIGLAVVGRRIAWAENHGGKARVRAVTLRR